MFATSLDAHEQFLLYSEAGVIPELEFSISVWGIEADRAASSLLACLTRFSDQPRYPGMCLANAKRLRNFS